MLKDPNEHFERAHELLGKAKDIETRHDKSLYFVTLAHVEATLSVAAGLTSLLDEMTKSKCGHGTVTLFTPCVDCAQVIR